MTKAYSPVLVFLDLSMRSNFEFNLPSLRINLDSVDQLLCLYQFIQSFVTVFFPTRLPIPP